MNMNLHNLMVDEDSMVYFFLYLISFYFICFIKTNVCQKVFKVFFLSSAFNLSDATIILLLCCVFLIKLSFEKYYNTIRNIVTFFIIFWLFDILFFC